MWPLKPEQQYHAVAADEEEAKDIKEGGLVQTSARRPVFKVIGAIILAGFFGTALVYVSYSLTSTSSRATPQEQLKQQTLQCPQRLEWRNLTISQQQEYISAVLCLKTIPSTLAPTTNFTAYDDFPWLHSHIGYATHHTAPFLPWHRYFLHIYERTLRSQCGYTGSLVYWDWTLDYQALEQSPIFDPRTGFGGDGDPNGDTTVGRSGRCVIDGPFAETHVPFYDIKPLPHCLSRGFRDLDGTLGHINGEDISPESISSILESSKTYEDFVTVMESKIHDVIPFGVAGDFETFTAPYDPIFWLHHTQLDRLWWMWQTKMEEESGKGLWAEEMYGGHRERHSIEMASLDDELRYGALAEGVRVRDVMDVQGDVLCYQY